MILIFHDSQGESDHQQFIEWAGLNPRGFFVNLRTVSDMTLHRAGCDHFIFSPDEKVSLTARTKVCSVNKDELGEWIKTYYPAADLKYCRDCEPG